MNEQDKRNNSTIKYDSTENSGTAPWCTVRYIARKAFIGMLAGTSFSSLIPIIISLFMGDGKFYPLMSQFDGMCKTQLGGIILQFVLCAVMGAGIGAGTVVWESELPLGKQTLISIGSIVVSYFPVAWICRWMPHSIRGVLFYTAVFLAMYFVMWGIIYVAELVKVRKINKRVGAHS